MLERPKLNRWWVLDRDRPLLVASDLLGRGVGDTVRGVGMVVGRIGREGATDNLGRSSSPTNASGTGMTLALPVGPSTVPATE